MEETPRKTIASSGPYLSTKSRSSETYRTLPERALRHTGQRAAKDVMLRSTDFIRAFDRQVQREQRERTVVI